MDIYEQWQENGQDTGQENALTLHIEGRLDAATVPLLEKNFERLKERVTSLTLDFSKVSYISSAGLRVLLVMVKWLNAKGGSFAIVNTPESVREVFATSGLIDLFVHDEKYVIIETAHTATELTLTLAGEFDIGAIMTLKAQLLKAEIEGIQTVALRLKPTAAASRRLTEALESLMASAKDRHIALTVAHEPA